MPIQSSAGSPLGISITNDEIADSTIEAVKLAFKPHKLIDTVVLTEAGNTIDFIGLDLNTDKAYKIVLVAENNGAVASDVSLYINDDTTATNYYRQYNVVSSSTYSGGQENAAVMFNVPASSGGVFEATILKSVDNYVYAQSKSVYARTTNLKLIDNVMSKTSAEANVTQLTLVGTQSFKIGTKAYLFALG